MLQRNLFLALLLLNAAVSMAAYPVLKPTQDGIRIDADFSEGTWQQGDWHHGFKLLGSRNHNQAKPGNDTRFKIAADSENLYLAIDCLDQEPEKINANIQGPSSNPWRDDVVELFFAPSGRDEEYYQFVVSAGGGSWQMYWAEKGNIKPDPFEPLYEIASAKYAQGWRLELRIPLYAFYMTRNKFWQNEWFFNMARCRSANGEWSTWSALNNSFHEVANFQRLSGMPIRAAQKDIFIKNASAQVDSSQSQGAYGGSLSIDIEAVSEAAGEYLLLLNSEALKEEIRQIVQLKAGSNSLLLPNISFKKSGKIPLQLELLKDGKAIAQRRYPLRIAFRPLELRFDSPAYSKCFFPGQDSSRISGVASVNNSATRLELELAGQKYSFPVMDGKASFSLDCGAVDAENLELKFKAGEDSLTERIRRLPALDNDMLWIEAPGRLVLNGKKVFALGWYGPGWIVSKCFQEKYPSPADKHPVNVGGWVNLEPGRLIKGSEAAEAVRDVKPSQAMFDKVRQTIESKRGSDFWFYYLSDEPECRGVSPIYLKHIYDFVKELDPYHPVMIISRDPGDYLDCCDIANPHPYTGPIINDNGERVLNQPVERVRRTLAPLAAQGRGDKLLMLTPQAFSYSINSIYADYPTFDESNAAIWSAICNGAQGFTPYIYYDHAARPSLSLGYDFIYNSLHSLSSILSSEQNPPCSSSNENVDARLFKKDGLLLAVLVNPYPEAHSAMVSAEAFKEYNSLYRYREQAQLPLQQGRISVELPPYAVLVLSSKKIDQGMSSMAELRRNIDKAEGARASRGNLLFGRKKDIEVSSSYSTYTYQSDLEQRDKMFDGIVDVSAWKPVPQNELWYELAFTKFLPKFSKARVYGYGLEGMTFKIKKRGEWLEPKAVRKTEKYSLELDFGESLSSVSVRLDFVMPKDRKEMVELYEIELLE